MNMKNWLEGIRLEKRKRALPILSFPCASLMGVTVRELVTDSKLQAKGMMLIADRYDTLASVSIMDLSVEAEAFGAQTVYSTDEVPTVVGALIKDLEDAEALAVPEVGAGRTARYVEALGMAKAAITDRPTLAGVIGPFSLSGRLMDVSEAMIKCYDEPDTVHAVLEKATDFLIRYISAYKEVGADGVMMAEPLGGMLSPMLAEEFSEPYVKRIVDALQDDSFIIVYHNCGDNVLYMADSIARTGAAAFHFGNSVKMTDMLKMMPEDKLIMGNVDPARELKNGTPESIRKAVFDIMSEATRHDNFVISSGCDIPPSAPTKNIDAFFEAVNEFYEG